MVVVESEDAVGGSTSTRGASMVAAERAFVSSVKAGAISATGIGPTPPSSAAISRG
jgi:hypothetical protein